MRNLIAGLILLFSFGVGTPAPFEKIGIPSVVTVAEAQYAQRFNPHGGVGTGGSDAAMHGVQHSQLHYEDQCRRIGAYNHPMCMTGNGRGRGAIRGHPHHGAPRGHFAAPRAVTWDTWGHQQEHWGNTTRMSSRSRLVTVRRYDSGHTVTYDGSARGPAYSPPSRSGRSRINLSSVYESY